MFVNIDNDSTNIDSCSCFYIVEDYAKLLICGSVNIVPVYAVLYEESQNIVCKLKSYDKGLHLFYLHIPCCDNVFL